MTTGDKGVPTHTHSITHGQMPGSRYAANLIKDGKSGIHDYRNAWFGQTGTDRKGKYANANADAYDRVGGEDIMRTMEDKREKRSPGFRHARRFVLSAETQIGKTGAYCFFLKLLADEIHGQDPLPHIPSQPIPLEPKLTQADKVKWLLPYWEDINRKNKPWPGLSIRPGKYHVKVKLQRLRLLLSVLRDTDNKQDWRDTLISRLYSLTGDGECAQSEFHRTRLDNLSAYLHQNNCEEGWRPLIVTGDFQFKVNGVKGKEVLQEIIDWDVMDRDRKNNSVYKAGADFGDPLISAGIQAEPGEGADGVYTLLEDQIGNVQTLAFESGCKEAQNKPGDGSGQPTTKHEYQAKVYGSASSQTSQIIKLSREASTTIKNNEFYWRHLFGDQETNWPEISVPGHAKDAFKTADDGCIKMCSEEGLCRFWILQSIWHPFLTFA